MELTIHIKCPDLTQAAMTLANALLGEHSKPAILAAPQPAVLSAAPVTPPVAAPMPVPSAAVPTAAASTIAPAAAAPVAPAPSMGAVPTAPAPSITLEQIGKAGADLLAANPGAMVQLTALLQRYGVASAQQLKPEQIGAFATELRGLGAKL